VAKGKARWLRVKIPIGPFHLMLCEESKLYPGGLGLRVSPEFSIFKKCILYM